MKPVDLVVRHFSGNRIPGNPIAYFKAPNLVDSIGISISDIDSIDPALRDIYFTYTAGVPSLRSNEDILTRIAASPFLNQDTLMGTAEKGYAQYAYGTDAAILTKAYAKYFKLTVPTNLRSVALNWLSKNSLTSRYGANAEWSAAGAVADGAGGVTTGLPRHNLGLAADGRTIWGVAGQPAYTNKIQNPKAVGASVGVLPTGYSSTSSNGITVSVVADGSGFAYRFQGVVAGSVSSPELRPSLVNNIAALSGQTWNASAIVEVIAGALPTVGLRLSIVEYTGAGAYLTETFTAYSANGLIEKTSTLGNASTGAVALNIKCSAIPASEAVDFTIRISQPQLTQTAYKMPFIAPPGDEIQETSSSSCASTTTHGLRWLMDSKILAALGTGGAFTLCSLDKMGAGSDEFTINIYDNSITSNDNANFSRFGKTGAGTATPIIAHDGSAFLGAYSAWNRYEIHARYIQTNPANPLQWRVGYRRYTAAMVAIDAAIVWSAWAAYDGSMNALTYLRAFYSNTTPVWKLAAMIHNTGNVSDAYLNSWCANAI